jgi:hypothetical protein
LLVLRTEKRCYRCGQLQAIEAFHANRAKADGHADEYRQCRREQQREYTQRVIQRNMALRLEGRA